MSDGAGGVPVTMADAADPKHVETISRPKVGDQVLVCFRGMSSLHYGICFPAGACKKPLSLPKLLSLQDMVELVPTAPLPEKPLALDTLVLARRCTGRYLPASVQHFDKGQWPEYHVKDIYTGEQLHVSRYEMFPMIEGSPMELDSDANPVFPEDDGGPKILQEDVEEVERPSTRFQQEMERRLGSIFQKASALDGVPRSGTLPVDTLKWIDVRECSAKEARARDCGPIPAMYQSGVVDAPGVLDYVGTNSKTQVVLWREGTTVAGAQEDAFSLELTKAVYIALPKDVDYVWLKFEQNSGMTHEFGMLKEIRPALVSVSRLVFRRQLMERDGEDPKKRSLLCKTATMSTQASTSNQQRKSQRKRNRVNYNEDQNRSDEEETPSKLTTFRYCSACGAPLPSNQDEEDNICEHCYVCDNCGGMLVPEEYELGRCEDCVAEIDNELLDLADEPSSDQMDIDDKSDIASPV